MNEYYVAVMYSVWGTDIFAFDTEEEAREFAREEYKKEEIYGYKIRKERDIVDDIGGEWSKFSDLFEEEDE